MRLFAVAPRLPIWRASVRHSQPRHTRHGDLALDAPSRFVCKASSAGADENPYHVLGLSDGASSDQVKAAYNRLRREAEIAGDKAALQRIEAANNTLFMSSLSSRMSGSGPVDKQVLYADRVDLLPWRPRLYSAPDNERKLAAGFYLLFVLYALLMTTTTSTVVTLGVVSGILNAYKQTTIDPANSADYQNRLEDTGKKVMRGIFLAFLATLLGILLFWTIPVQVCELIGFVVPDAIFLKQNELITLGTAVFQLLTFCFFR